MATSNADEFGDDSFLADFDVDAAIAARNTPEKVATHAQKPPKRAKVSLSPEVNNRDVQRFLQEKFGFNKFRPGQNEAIQSVLDGRDVAIFWATGSGKSICYQLPALYSKRVALVVSPLISLMQDQVRKINGNNECPVATFLGSGQMDGQEESRALRGEYNLVYLTPEKLLSGNFLDQVATNLDLCLIAIDESHCVSAWGHDFRPEYRQAGSAIRRHPRLTKIPLMALTATAVPRIQEDIMNSLQLQSPFISQQSFDRPNLKIQVLPKETSNNALRCSMEHLVRYLQQNKPSASSTLVYAATKREVDDLYYFLQQRLESEGCDARVGRYHAGLSHGERQSTHEDFLTGKDTVVVATNAFGMGIDKPDIRRVIHFGPPKTVEDYYQQVGRAGRDGLPGECILYYSPTDFTKYSSDFYLGGKSREAQEASLQSTNALKTFCLDKETCRRKALLNFFSETPSFGNRCGNCDNCLNSKKFGEDSTRDYTDVAKLILDAMSGLDQQGITNLLAVLNGKEVEQYRYKRDVSPSQLKKRLEEKRGLIPIKMTTESLKEFVAALTQKNYIQEITKSSHVNGYDRTYTVFTINQSGWKLLTDPNATVYLPVPNAIRDAEERERARREKVLKQLEDHGFELDKIPEDEVRMGDGEVIRAYSKWTNYKDSLQKNQKEDRVTQLEELLSLVESWRSDAAGKLIMAPANVLPDHIMYSIAYTSATLPRGMKVDTAALRAVGARTRDLQSLVDVLTSWSERYRPPGECSGTSSQKGRTMSFPAGHIRPPQKWKYAIYKPQKKTGKASWESSWERFLQDDCPQAIAMTPTNGRPIQVSTVVGHIQDGFLQGREVDLKRLAAFSPPPTEDQWQELERAELTMGMDVTGDPTTSGMNGEKAFSMTDMLRPIMGDEFADKPYQERGELEQAKFGEWCNLLKWFMLLKRVNFVPNFKG